MDVNYGPTKVVDCAITDISSLRLTSRLIKNEIDYEVSRDAMKQMMASTRLICNWSECLTDDLNAPPYPEWSGKLLYASPRPKTYKDIQNLRITTSTLGAHWIWDMQDFLKATKPHVRSLTFDMTILKHVLEPSQEEQQQFVEEDMGKAVLNMWRAMCDLASDRSFRRRTFRPLNANRPIRVQLNFSSSDPDIACGLWKSLNAKTHYYGIEIRKIKNEQERVTGAAITLAGESKIKYFRFKANMALYRVRVMDRTQDVWGKFDEWAAKNVGCYNIVHLGPVFDRPRQQRRNYSWPLTDTRGLLVGVLRGESQ